MSQALTSFLALSNDILQSAIVIFGAAVVLYNLRLLRHDRVVRAFLILVSTVVVVYFAELASTRTTTPVNAELWLRLEWIGIALVPAALAHLADALLDSTGDGSFRRRIGVYCLYGLGTLFMILVFTTDLVAEGLVSLNRAIHLRPGTLFPWFAAYFWLVAFWSLYQTWRARRRTITATRQRRMSMILATVIAAPLGVFPYLMASARPDLGLPLVFLIVLLVGNVVVGIMFSFLTYYISFFGAVSPDRVVRVRLFKFMARVPLAGVLVLLVFIAVTRAGDVLGLPVQTAVAIAVVATVMLVEWAVHNYKRPFERFLQLNNDPEVRLIQSLSDRILTTTEVRQFLESVLAATCDAVRSPSAFIAAIGPTRPTLEATIGPMHHTGELLLGDGLDQLTQLENGVNGTREPLTFDGPFIIWRDYWIQRLYDRDGEVLLGILGVKATSDRPNLSPEDMESFQRLVQQAAAALEDRFLQQEVFAAVEGLLPTINAIQARRQAAARGVVAAANQTAVLEDPDFVGLVRDALNHYWGGPKLTESPLLELQVVRGAIGEHDGNPINALRAILLRAIEQQKPDGERNLTTGEWILYNILELKFLQGKKVRDVARRLAMSESDLYRKQRVAIENVARTVAKMEQTLTQAAEPESAA